MLCPDTDVIFPASQLTFFMFRLSHHIRGQRCRFCAAWKQSYAAGDSQKSSQVLSLFSVDLILICILQLWFHTIQWTFFYKKKILTHRQINTYSNDSRTLHVNEKKKVWLIQFGNFFTFSYLWVLFEKIFMNKKFHNRNEMSYLLRLLMRWITRWGLCCNTDNPGKP